MKLTIILFFLTSFCFSQNNAGTAFYKKDVKAKEFSNSSNQEIHDMLVQASRDLLFELNFNDSTSTFQLQEKVHFNQRSLMKYKLGAAGYDGIIFTNNSSKILLAQKEIGGKRFLINYPSPYFKWELIDKTKKIGDYMCYKAIHIKKYKDKNGNAQEKLITAWYAPEIPLSFGPHIYSGLPGLIIELDNEAEVFRLTKIKFKEGMYKIKRPKKGLSITKEEYGRLVKKAFNAQFGHE